MTDSHNYYSILQVSFEADSQIIKAAYYTQLRIHKKHPDLGGSTEEAILLNEAYEVLSDPVKRKEYDKKFFKRKQKDSSAHSKKQRGPDPEPPKKEQRRSVRASFQQRLHLKQALEREWAEAQFRDISLFGACIRCLRPFKVNEILELDISRTPVLKGKAVVRWVRTLPQRFGSPIYEGGIEFQNMDEQALHQFLRKAGLRELLEMEIA